MKMAVDCERTPIDMYKHVYDDIVELSLDADAFGWLDSISEEDIEKAKWFYMILDCLNDVPLRRVNQVFKQKGLSPEQVKEEMEERIYGDMSFVIYDKTTGCYL